MSTHNQSKNQQLIAELLSQNTAAQSTKATILEAYLKIAVKEGTTALSLTRLAEELNISKQLVRYHVPDLDQAALELFKITALTGASFTQKSIEGVIRWEEKVLSWIHATFDWVVAYPDFAKFLLFMYHRASVDTEVKELHSKIVNTGRNRLKEVINSCPKKNIQNNSTQLTLIIHQLITAALIEMLSMNDIKNQASYKKTFILSTEYILGTRLK
ncbi:MAG: hypothetical protein R3A80_13675 [Bdellovibrionota bacterium]